jgi:hypothetical protein
MTTFLQRIKNLWRISAVDTSTTYGKLTLETMAKAYNESVEAPRPARIVKMKKPVEEFLKDNKE